MRRIWLGVLFYVWMYGAPFLFVIALIRRTSTPFTPAPGDAAAFESVTGTLFTVSLAADLLLPAAGLLLSKLTRDAGWQRQFTGALITVPLLFLVFCVAST